MKNTEEKYADLMWHSVGESFYRDKLAAIDFRDGCVLDVGCGPGQWSVAAAKSNKTVTAIDSNPNFIHYLNDHLAANNITNVRTSVADAAAFSAESAFYDFVVCYNMIQYVQEDELLKRIAAVMKEGGKLFLSTNGSGYYLEKIVSSLKGLRLRAVLSYLLLIARSWLLNFSVNFGRKTKERYLSVSRLVGLLEDNDLKVTELRLGGLPTNRRETYLLRPYFFEVLCVKRGSCTQPMKCQT